MVLEGGMQEVIIADLSFQSAFTMIGTRLVGYAQGPWQSIAARIYCIIGE